MQALRITVVFLLTSFLFIGNVQANDKDDLALGLALFKKGAYNQVIERVTRIRSNQLRGTKHYLLGLSYARSQRFDLAVKHLKKALRYQNKSKDIYYELGQALYANNDLRKARKAFVTSYRKKYKPLVALYYMAYISQLLEEYKQAKKFYARLTKEHEVDLNLKQIAQFQLAEVLTSLNKSKNDDRNIMIKYIFPQYQKALDLDPDSTLATDIRKRIEEIKRLYRLDPNLMINGRILPKKRITIKFNQKISFDNNITMATDLPTTTSTQKESFIFDSQLYAKYQQPLKNRYVIEPELRITHTFYGDRDTPEVFQNDTLSISPALRMRLEHTLLGKMASLHFDVEHNITNRDREAKKDKIFYGRATTFVLGEKFRYFKSGDTTIKLKRKNYDGYDPTGSGDYDSTTIQLSQVMMRQNGDLALLLFINDYTRMVTDTTQDTDSYLFRLDYIIPTFYQGFGLHLGLALTLLDTKEQSDSRGLEKTYNPSIELTKKISKQVSYNLSYDYTKKDSDNTAYSYKKQTFTFELKIKF